MKPILALILLITIVARPTFHIGYYGYYKLNIDEIIEKYCVNKERPQLQCNGKCHLAETLAITQDNEGAKQPISLNVIEAFTFMYYQVFSKNWSFLSKELSVSNFTFKKAKYLQPLLNITLPPPRI